MKKKVKKKRALEKAMLALLAKTPARNQTGCGKTVKLLKETAAKPQEAKKQEAEEYFSVLQNKHGKIYHLYLLYLYVKEFMILKSCQQPLQSSYQPLSKSWL